MEPLVTLYDLWTKIVSVFNWFLKPSVYPWAGAVAAFIAALCLEPRKWLKSPWELMSRPLKVSIVWLLLAFLLSGITQWSSCKGWGTGRRGGTGDGAVTIGGAEDAAESKDGSTATGDALRKIGEDVFCERPNVICIIRFLPSVGKPREATPFSCDVLVRGDNSPAKKEIRAQNMLEFEDRLRDTLKQVVVPENLADPKIRVWPIPFPGENVLRKVRDLAAVAVPRATVVLCNGENHERRQ